MRRVLRISLGATAAAVIGTAAIPQFASIEDPTINGVLVDLEMLRKLVAERARATGALPSNEAGLTDLLNGTPPLIGKLPPDRWGHRYVYRRTEVPAGFVVYSVGKNGVDELGRGDDVTDSSKQYACDVYSVNCPRTALDLLAYAIVALGALGLAGLFACAVNATCRAVARKSAA